MFSQDPSNCKGFFLKHMGLSLCDRNKGRALGFSQGRHPLAELRADGILRTVGTAEPGASHPFCVVLLELLLLLLLAIATSAIHLMSTNCHTHFQG